jgi:purine-nucleoside phosphorylase
VRVLKALGARMLIVSNACGGLNPLWRRRSDADRRSHQSARRQSAHRSERRSAGPRFPDLSAPYDPSFARRRATWRAEQGFTLREGVYVAVAGRISRRAPSIVLARHRCRRRRDVDGARSHRGGHAGMRVLGLSIITDMCLPDALEPATVERSLPSRIAPSPR